MVLLKLFTGQISDKTDQINQFQNVEAAKSMCSGWCSKAKTNDCREDDLIAFCVSNFQLDLDENFEIGTFSNGAYDICEDRIYCPLEVNCVCGRTLSMENCVTIMNEYYTRLHGSEGSKQRIMSQLIYSKGACSIENNGGPNSWYNLFVVPNLPE